MHYNRWLRNGDANVRTKREFKTKQKCKHCDGLVVGRGLCSAHHQQWLRRGDPLAPNLRGERWTDKELAHLYAILDRRPDRLGHALPREALHLSYIIGRTVVSIRSKLHEVRAKRKCEANQKIK